MGILPDGADHGAQELRAVEQWAHRVQWMTSASSTEKPWSGRAAGRFEHGVRVPSQGARVTVPGLEQRDAGGRHPPADTAQLVGGGPVTSLSHPVLESSCPLAIAGTDPTMDRVQVKKRAMPISNRNPDVHR
jgi:hypothetical protein